MTIPRDSLTHVDRITGCLIGIAVGDAIGLPFENLSRHQIARSLNDHPIGHRLLFGRGMVSDDTEHSCLVGQALVASGGEPSAFARDLAWRLRWWIAGVPAGAGRATARACGKLWIGFNYQSSGVFSAGNGTAMRAPIIGASTPEKDRAIQITNISSRITHTDPKAAYGALAISSVAHAVTFGDRETALMPDQVLERVGQWLQKRDDDATELLGLVGQAAESVERGESLREFADSMEWNRGVSGYIYQTVPAVLHACMRYPNDYRSAIEELVLCGGDTDSTASVAGGILGAADGEAGIPSEWINGLIEFPRNQHWMRGLSEQLGVAVPHSSPLKPVGANPLLQLMRNAIFLTVILIHAFARIPMIVKR